MLLEARAYSGETKTYKLLWHIVVAHCRRKVFLFKLAISNGPIIYITNVTLKNFTFVSFIAKQMSHFGSQKFVPRRSDREGRKRTHAMRASDIYPGGEMSN